MNERDLMAHRIAHLRTLHGRQLEKYHFENGMRAGIELALRTLDGVDMAGNPIDPPKKGVGK